MTGHKVSNAWIFRPLFEWELAQNFWFHWVGLTLDPTLRKFCHGFRDLYTLCVSRLMESIWHLQVCQLLPSFCVFVNTRNNTTTSLFCTSCNDSVLGPIHTGRARANPNANPLMLLACSVNTPIYAHRFHLLCVALRVLCGWGLSVLDKYLPNDFECVSIITQNYFHRPGQNGFAVGFVKWRTGGTVEGSHRFRVQFML